MSLSTHDATEEVMNVPALASWFFLTYPILAIRRSGSSEVPSFCIGGTSRESGSLYKGFD